MVDTTGMGDFSKAVKAVVTKQIPGKKGNIQKSNQKRWERVLRSLGIMKRATNINEDYVSLSSLVNSSIVSMYTDQSKSLSV